MKLYICQGLSSACGNGQSQCDKKNICTPLHWKEHGKEARGAVMQPFCHESRDRKNKCAGKEFVTCAGAREYITSMSNKGIFVNYFEDTAVLPVPPFAVHAFTMQDDDYVIVIS